MLSRSSSLALSLAAAVFVLGGCDKRNNDDVEDPTDDTADEAAEADLPVETLAWYTTCGDPVCGGYGGPWPDVPACAMQVEGDPCEMADETCDFISDCNAVLVCAGSDPKLQPGGCPISRAEFKTDIEYTDASALAGFYQTALDLRLATWRYRGRADGKQSLGVILEDGESASEPAIWADTNNDRVDLYSYGSLAIAGVQVQATELAELRAQMQAMQRELAELRERADACED